MVANYDLSAPISGSIYQNLEAGCPVVRKTRIIDFAEAVTLKGSNLVAGDSIKAMTFDAGSLVLAVYVRQVVAGTPSSTFSVGSAATSTLYVATVSADAVAQTMKSSTIGASFFSSADYVNFTLGATPTLTGKVEVNALLLPIGTSLTR